MLAVLTGQPLSDEAVKRADRDAHLGLAKMAQDSARVRANAERRLAVLDREVTNLVGALAAGAADMPELVAALHARRDERSALEAELAEHAAPSIIALHPKMRDVYRQRIANLAQSLERLAIRRDRITALVSFIFRILRIIR